MTNPGKNAVADTELGRVVLGVSPFTAEIPLRSFLVSWVWRLFKKVRVEDVIRVPSTRAHVYIPEDDDGHVDFYFMVVNMTDRPLSVQRFFLSRFAASGKDVSIQVPLFKEPNEPVPPRGIREVHLSVPLGAPAIRHLLRVVDRPSTPMSSPRVELMVVGVLEGGLGGVQVRVPFTVAAYTPELRISCPSSKTLNT